MENRDRVRDQSVPDQPPSQPMPGDEGEEQPGKRRVREEEDSANDRPSPRREPERNPAPKMA